MANSRFEYVRQFELPDPLLKNTWIVVRIDGKCFHKYKYVYVYVITVYIDVVCTFMHIDLLQCMDIQNQMMNEDLN